MKADLNHTHQRSQTCFLLVALIVLSAMKGVGIAFLMNLILLQSFSKWIIIADYQINRDYIASKLCVNRNLPKLHCNGKCQMMKKVAEEEKNNVPAGSTKMQEPCVIQHMNVSTTCNSIASTPEYGCHLLRPYNFMPPSSVFHPPSLL